LLSELAIRQSEKDKALTYLKKTLEIAVQQGYSGSILENKMVMDQLTRQPPHFPDPLRQYVQKIVGAANKVDEKSNPIKEFMEIENELIVPLSERELEILSLIHQGYSNQKISEHLTITLGTTKWHTVNIFKKLKVHSRTQAIARGLALNMLESEND
jgi:LuxR family maltose regulon positive regulatory protein